MSAQPIVITPESQAEWQAFAEKAVRTVRVHRGDAERLRIAHAAAAVEVGVLRMALMRDDFAGALEALEVLARIHAMHAHEMGVEVLPPGVTCLDTARAAAKGRTARDGGRL